MAIRLGINGFGRIGRLVFQALCDQGLLGKEIDVVGVVDISTDADYFAYQLKYDSVHGRFAHKVTHSENAIQVAGRNIRVSAVKDPSQLPHKELGVDVVLECTGKSTAATRP